MLRGEFHCWIGSLQNKELSYGVNSTVPINTSNNGKQNVVGSNKAKPCRQYLRRSQLALPGFEPETLRFRRPSHGRLTKQDPDGFMHQGHMILWDGCQLLHFTISIRLSLRLTGKNVFRLDRTAE